MRLACWFRRLAETGSRQARNSARTLAHNNRDREDALASTRDACATQSGTAATCNCYILLFFLRHRRGGEFLEARIISEGIEHGIEPEQRRSNLLAGRY